MKIHGGANARAGGEKEAGNNNLPLQRILRPCVAVRLCQAVARDGTLCMARAGGHGC